MSNNSGKYSINMGNVKNLSQVDLKKKIRALGQAFFNEGAAGNSFKIAKTNANNRYPQTHRYPTTGSGRYNNMIENAAERKNELEKAIAVSNTSHTYNHNESKEINKNIRTDHYDHAKLAQVQRDILFKELSIKEKNKLLNLVENGAIIYKNGKYHTDTKMYQRFLDKLEKKQRELDYEHHKKIKNDEVEKKTKAISSRIANLFTISRANERFIRKLVSKKYDRDEMKNIKKQYKKQCKINKWEKKYGK